MLVLRTVALMHGWHMNDDAEMGGTHMEHVTKGLEKISPGWPDVARAKAWLNQLEEATAGRPSAELAVKICLVRLTMARVRGW